MMEFSPLYWHWLLLGLALLLSEIFLASFTLFWFGLGAVVTGLALLVQPGLALSAQLGLWLVASIAFTVAWFKVFKPRMHDHTKAGLSREAALGESGVVLRAPVGEQRGIVRFTLPLVGSDEWEFVCEQPVNPGDKVVITDISGNTLVVAPQQN